jgi:hypothetical protein
MVEHARRLDNPKAAGLVQGRPIKNPYSSLYQRHRLQNQTLTSTGSHGMNLGKFK